MCLKPCIGFPMKSFKPLNYVHLLQKLLKEHDIVLINPDKHFILYLFIQMIQKKVQI